MSVDLQIDQTCPHEISDEALYLSGDRRTVRPLRPIASAASVKVLLNHAIAVPSYGSYLPAKVLGLRKGPFNITTGRNDVFSIRVDAGEEQRVMLPNATKMAAHQVAGYLNRRLVGVTLSVVNDALVMTSVNAGPGASLFLNAESTASITFGISSNCEYRGLRNVPGWTLVCDPSTLDDRPTRLIVFDEPLRSGSDFVELCYGTIREECRRCGGSGIESDWRYDVNGNPVLVRDDDLLMQELQKDFFTILGSNPFHSWYGTSIVEQIGRKLTSGGLSQNMIAMDIHQAFARWQSIKVQQEAAGYDLSDKEFPFRLLAVNVQQSAKDPTVMFVDVRVQNRSSQPIQLTRGFKVPQAYGLSADNMRPTSSGYSLVS